MTQLAVYPPERPWAVALPYSPVEGAALRALAPVSSLLEALLLGSIVDRDLTAKPFAPLPNVLDPPTSPKSLQERAEVTHGVWLFLSKKRLK